MNISHAVDAFSDITNRHVNGIVNHIDDDFVASHDEKDSNYPIYCKFYNDRGSPSIKDKCNFDSTQFFDILVMIEYYASNNWNISGGRRTQHRISGNSKEEKK